jgi:uncharacterized protein YjdB
MEEVMNFNLIKQLLKKYLSLIAMGVVSIALLITVSVVVANEDNTVISSSTNETSLVSSSNTNNLSNELELVSIEVNKLPTITTYSPVDTISTSGGELRVVFSDYSVRYVSMNDNMIDTTRLYTSSVGTTRVTLSYSFNGDTLFTSYNVNIVPFVINPTSLSLDIASSDVLLDQVVNLNYIIEPSNATYSSVVWSSSNPLIASVDDNGLVTPKNVGEVVITATVDNNLTGSAKLNIIDNSPVSEQIDPALLPVISNVSISFSNTNFAQTTESLSLDFYSNKPGNYYYIIQGRTDDYPTINQLTSSNRNGQIQEGLINRLIITGFDYSNDMKLYMIVRTPDGFTSLVLEQDLSPTYLITYGWVPIVSNSFLNAIRQPTNEMNIGFYGYYQFSTNYADTSATHLNALRRNFFLTNDIDLSSSTFSSGLGWVPIGNDSTPFVGKFNGLNYKIKGLTINRGARYQGLFGNIDGADIRNIVFEDVSITIPVNSSDIATLTSFGTLVGYSLDSIINNVRVFYGTKTSSVKIYVNSVPPGGAGGVNLPLYLGGIVGLSINTNISNVIYNGNVDGANAVGGIAGVFETASGSTRTLSRAMVNGNISGTRRVGGVVGVINDSIMEIASYNGGISLNVGGNGQATLTDTGIYFGGISGTTTGSLMTESYADATISNAQSDVGGFTGYLSGSLIAESYVRATINSLVSNNTSAISGSTFGSTVTGSYYNVIINGALAENSTSDANLRLQSTYVGWDTNIWRFDDVNYPLHNYN